MSTTARPGLPSFWSTDIAKALTGDQPCLLSPFMKGHFNLDKQPRGDASSLAKWKADHTAMLHAESDRLKADGWKLRIEQFFRLTGTNGVLSGKPDIIAQAEGRRPKIIDLKSGTPRDSDTMQVLLYLICIPLAWRSPEMIFEGEVVYQTHRVPIKANEVDGVRDRVFALLRRLSTQTRPDASPSESACRFCDVNEQDCPERFQVGSNVDILTSEF